MKTKIVPFDLETAKKIQAGKIEGRIKDKRGLIGTIITFNCGNTSLPIVVEFRFCDRDDIFFVGNDGVSNNKHIELVLEIPDNELQFKPFDKVLVRDRDDEEWECALFSHISDGKPCYTCVGSLCVYQCIPFEGNEDLVGTTNKPKEE